MAAFQARDKLVTAAQSYYNDEQFSDFTIACEGREFKVHRCFIAPHSKFFEKACSGMFKETQQRRIDLKEDDPSMVEHMVKFFYTFDYDNTPEESETSQIGLHARIYTIADKYEVLILKGIALAKFKGCLSASFKDGKVMVEGTHALTEARPLPTCDTTMHDIMIEAWLHGGEQLLADIGEAEVSSLFTEATWLSVALAIRMFKGLKADSLRGSCTNGCTHLTRMEPEAVMSGAQVRCGRCNVLIHKAGVKTKLSKVELKSWAEFENPG